MANSKISGLTGATTPLAGTETLPVVQSGVTKQVAVTNLTAGRAVSANSITLTTALDATSGGTGSTNAFVSNAIPYASSTTVLSTSSNFTYDGINFVLLNGGVGINSSSLTGRKLVISGAITGAVTSYGEYIAALFQSDVTTHGYGIRSQNGTQNALFNLTFLSQFAASQNAIGATSTVTNQYGFNADSSITGATNNYGFYGAIAAATNRYNFYAAGTAQNLFSGDVLVFGAGGLGYTTGSGGAVTQGTSRTTGVTLNKTNGAITLFTAAGAIAATTFTVTNSAVAATDVVNVCQKSGTNLYNTLVTAVAAGSFNITFFTTGGVANDAPVFNFAVTKAVTA